MRGGEREQAAAIFFLAFLHKGVKFCMYGTFFGQVTFSLSIVCCIVHVRIPPQNPLFSICILPSTALATESRKQSSERHHIGVGLRRGVIRSLCLSQYKRDEQRFLSGCPVLCVSNHGILWRARGDICYG